MSGFGVLATMALAAAEALGQPGLAMLSSMGPGNSAAANGETAALLRLCGCGGRGVLTLAT